MGLFSRPFGDLAVAHTIRLLPDPCVRLVSAAEGWVRWGALGDHQCDQEMLVRKERQNAIAKKFGRAVQRVRVPSDQSLASGSVASLAASVATLGPMRRHASG